jgi:hypothetical protein
MQMRTVEIKQDANGQRRWIAVDRKSGEVVLRIHDEGLLRNICRSLDWKVVEPQSQHRP